MTNKQLVIRAVRALPDHSTMDEIEERIAILAGIVCGRDGTIAGDDPDQGEMNRLVAELLSLVPDHAVN
jgi:hypothetical protein